MIEIDPTPEQAQLIGEFISQVKGKHPGFRWEYWTNLHHDEKGMFPVLHLAPTWKDGKIERGHEMMITVDLLNKSASDCLNYVSECLRYNEELTG